MQAARTDGTHLVQQLPMDGWQRDRPCQYSDQAGRTQLRQQLEGSPTKAIHLRASSPMTVRVEARAHAAFRVEVRHQHGEEPQLLVPPVLESPDLPQLFAPQLKPTFFECFSHGGLRTLFLRDDLAFGDVPVTAFVRMGRAADFQKDRTPGGRS